MDFVGSITADHVQNCLVPPRVEIQPRVGLEEESINDKNFLTSGNQLLDILVRIFPKWSAHFCQRLVGFDFEHATKTNTDTS